MRILSCYAVFFLAVLAAAPVFPVQVPIQVVPLVPSDATATWVAGVVTVGVPLAAGDHIQDVSQLGFQGAKAAQFRALQRDPETQDIRWVQVHFLAEQPDMDFALTRGSGAFGAAALAREAPDGYHIDTGAAQFTVSRGGFQFLSNVTIQERRVAGSQHPQMVQATKHPQGASEENPSETVPGPLHGGLVVLADGQRFESALDDASTLQLEENGPVRAVLLHEGVLRNAAGDSHLGYSVRMVFEHSSRQVRVFVTLRNADARSVSAKTFDAAWLELPLLRGETRQVTTWVDGQRHAGVVDPLESAWLYQADNQHLRSGRTSRIVSALCVDQGVQLHLGASESIATGNTNNIANGLFVVQGQQGSVLAGMRDMAAQFPSGFHLENGSLGVDLFSRHNTQRQLLFAWGAHETRELLFEFAPGIDLQDPRAAATDAQGERFLDRLQHPWIGRCSFEHYRDTGAVFGESRLVSVAEESSFFAAVGHRWTLNDLRSRDLEYDRQYSFRTTGGGNQFDQDLTRLIDFMRGNHTGRFLQARLNVLWKADQAVYHSDNFDMGQYQNGISDVDAPDPDTFHGKGAGSVFDDEHPHWTSMILYYWLTGDERVRGAIEDYGEYRLFRAGHPYWGAIHGGGINHFRLWSRALRDVALMYEFTGEERYLEALRTMARTLTETIETGSSRGRNLQRGYFYFGDPADTRRRIHLFFLTEMNPIGVREAMRVLPQADPLREELRDYLTGLAWFTLREAILDDDARGYPYGYYANEVNHEPGKRGDQTGLLLAHGYEQTGHTDFIEQARRLAWRVIEAQHELRASELSTLVRIHAWNHRQEVQVELLQPQAEANLDGSWTLRWTVPQGARSYVIKYGRKRLVANLDFDQRTRTYRVHPTQAMNFWAASNLSDEPAALPGGNEQVWRTPILPAGRWQFAIQVAREGSWQDPIDVEELEASAGDTAVSLAWKLHPTTQRSVTAVTVERATRQSGPWITVSTTPFRPQESMRFEDQGVVADEVYFYRLRIMALDGTVSFTKPVLVRTSRQRLGARLLTPRAPPDGGGIEIRYSLGSPTSPVLLSIYDVRGRRIQTFLQGFRQAGTHLVRWNRRDATGSKVASGLYFVRLEAGALRQARKLILR